MSMLDSEPSSLRKYQNTLSKTLLVTLYLVKFILMFFSKLVEELVLESPQLHLLIKYWYIMLFT
jgi:hypothetical protein